AEIEAHFRVKVTECEEPQFLRYETGDYFVAHQDGNTPMVWDDSRFRRISAVIFLSRKSGEPAPDTYGGGALVFHGAYTGLERERVAAAAAPGSLVTFRAETTHEVTPVTHGVRYTIATWFR
ncbi:MAG TPA: 2OG-Fe(II) oxygenase, partial [Longimicrobium sp.]|nr:2OG-Fe(II) oxygenase [Longimicrobium sp.]